LRNKINLISLFCRVSQRKLLGEEAKILLKKLSAMLAEKWEKPHSEVCGYVDARMSIAIVRATLHYASCRTLEQQGREDDEGKG
jgi:hypothetical protein